MRRPPVAVVLIMGLASCASPTVPVPSAPPSAPLATAGSPALVGVWSTDPVSFDDIRAAMVAEGIPEADFVTWAEDQVFAPWPEAPGAPSAITIQLRFEGAGHWEATVESGGQSAGVVESGSWDLEGGALALTAGPGGEDRTLFNLDLDGDRLALTVLDVQEGGDHVAAYLHLRYAVALYASASFTRTT